MSEDIIKRSDAIKDLCDISNNSDMPNDWHRGMSVAISALYRVPSVPPADRPQGEWFKDDEGTFICSACGSGYKDQPTLMGKPMFKWCPICGCRMKGADDE